MKNLKDLSQTLNYRSSELGDSHINAFGCLSCKKNVDSQVSCIDESDSTSISDWLITAVLEYNLSHILGVFLIKQVRT